MEAHERERLLVDQSLRDLSALFLLLAFPVHHLLCFLLLLLLLRLLLLLLL